MYPGYGVIFLFCFWELGNALLNHNLGRERQNLGISTNEDFTHVWLKTRYSTSSIRGEGYWVIPVYLEDRLDPCCTKGKFFVLNPGGVIHTWLS